MFTGIVEELGEIVAVEHDGETFAVDVMAETLSRSSLGSLQAGAKVNLERAMAASTRFGGHIVQGHVDATAKILARMPGDTFSVSLIPTTLELTTLGHKGVGDLVNLEVDVIAKYVEQLLTHNTTRADTTT